MGVKKMKHIFYNGYTFTKDRRGYYLSTKPIDGKRRLLHRYVWFTHNGEIPKGFNVHHKDEDKRNNDISNLELMTKSDHSKYHSNKMVQDNPEEVRQRFLKATQEKAKEWHRSKEGIEWHKTHAIKSLGKTFRKTEKTSCIICGKEYMTTKYYKDKTKFCSKKCKAKYRRDMKLDHIIKECVICGKEFSSNKYDKVKTCGKKDCKSKSMLQSRKGVIEK